MKRAIVAMMVTIFAVMPSLAEDSTVPAKKVEVKKAQVEKAAPKKPAPKKPAPVTKPVKKSAPAAPAGPPNVTVYRSSQKMAPTLRDKEGNLIPTSPDAYDVSSATGGKR